MGHWYLPDGKPFYEVENKSRGGMRPATIRDARKVGAVPSVTTVLACAHRPGLENWKIEQNILAALTNPDVTPEMPVKDIMRLIKKDAMEQAKQAADAGTDIHDSIEAHFKGGRVPKEHLQTVCAVKRLLHEYCGEQNWEAERWFTSGLGYGGKIDLISPEWVIDFKTKEGDAMDHKMYPEQLMQLVAYDYGTGEGSRRYANIIVSRDKPGSAQFWEWQSDDDAYRAWRKFRALLEYWHYDNDYFPHIEEAA